MVAVEQTLHVIRLVKYLVPDTAMGQHPVLAIGLQRALGDAEQSAHLLIVEPFLEP